jgi:O-acetylserine/cysteine efflux transporter
MTPVLTILGAAYITGEPVSLQLIVGGLIALAGVLVILLRPGLPFLKPFMSRHRD